MRKIYHIEFKDCFYNFYYGDLTVLCNTWRNIGVSKFTLDRWDFDKPYENDICIIRKDKLITSTRTKLPLNIK